MHAARPAGTASPAARRRGAPGVPVDRTADMQGKWSLRGPVTPVPCQGHCRLPQPHPDGRLGIGAQLLVLLSQIIDQGLHGVEVVVAHGGLQAIHGMHKALQGCRHHLPPVPRGRRGRHPRIRRVCAWLHAVCSGESGAGEVRLGSRGAGAWARPPTQQPRCAPAQQARQGSPFLTVGRKRGGGVDARSSPASGPRECAQAGPGRHAVQPPSTQIARGGRHTAPAISFGLSPDIADQPRIFGMQLTMHHCTDPGPDMPLVGSSLGRWMDQSARPTHAWAPCRLRSLRRLHRQARHSHTGPGRGTASQALFHNHNAQKHGDFERTSSQTGISTVVGGSRGGPQWPLA